MILHNEIFNEVAQVHCDFKNVKDSVSKFATIQILCNSKDSIKCIEDKAERKLIEEKAVSLLDVKRMQIIQRIPLEKDIVVPMANINPPKQQQS